MFITVAGHHNQRDHNGKSVNSDLNTEIKIHTQTQIYEYMLFIIQLKTQIRICPAILEDSHVFC